MENTLLKLVPGLVGARACWKQGGVLQYVQLEIDITDLYTFLCG